MHFGWFCGLECQVAGSGQRFHLRAYQIFEKNVILIQVLGWLSLMWLSSDVSKEVRVHPYPTMFFQECYIKNVISRMLTLHKKMNFSIKDFFRKCGQIQFSAGLVAFTEEILNGKLHFLCSVSSLIFLVISCSSFYPNPIDSLDLKERLRSSPKNLFKCFLKFIRHIK